MIIKTLQDIEKDICHTLSVLSDKKNRLIVADSDVGKCEISPGNYDLRFLQPFFPVFR